MTENDRTNPTMRKQITQLMFESIGVNSFFIANQAVLSLYSTGRTTGLSIQAGDSGTQIVPIIDGYALSHGVNSQRINGNDLTSYMQRLLFELNVDLQTTAELQIVREIKEKHTRVALDYDKELEQFNTQSNLSQTYILPDDSQITLNEQMIKCGESIFNPQLMGKDC